FQEFHGEHPWLFDKGRLVGGKPVPGVGWIFTPRIPVRGPKSRRAQSKAKDDQVHALSPPVKAAELAKAAKKVAARKVAVLPDGTKPKVGDVWPAGALLDAGTPEVPVPRMKKAEPKHTERRAAKAKTERSVAEAEPTGSGAAPSSATRRKRTAKEAPAQQAGAAVAKKAVAKKAPTKEAAVKAATGKAEAMATEPAKKKGVKTAPVKTAPAKKKEGAKKAPAKRAPTKEPGARAVSGKAVAVAVTVATEPAKKKKAGEKAGPGKAAATRTKAMPASMTPVPKASRPTVTSEGDAPPERRAAAKNPVVQEAIGRALAEAIAPDTKPPDDGRRAPEDHKRAKRKEKEGHGRRRSASPPPAVNEPLAFITFVATYPLERELEGEVVSFTSHGAMVDVDLPGGGVLHAYIPLTAMGDPPPTKARQVLTRGERRQFVLVTLDPPRRVAELALPEIVKAQNGARP
ncbi:MAG: hypothetical protein ACRDV8_07940, partial [Acidimicrobiales bacterium]